MVFALSETAFKHLLEQQLTAMVLPARSSRFDQVLRQRTRYMAIVLENIYQPHNASAVLRSCDCFGIQDVHIIENSNEYVINPDVAMGAAQWLSLHHYRQSVPNTESCYSALRRQGYRVVATSPQPDSSSIYDFDFAKSKFALVFGTELGGLTGHALAQADETVHIPMHGFTESLNISVSVALCCFYFTQQFREKQIPWQLSEEDWLDVRLDWLRMNVRNSSGVENALRRSFSEKGKQTL